MGVTRREWVAALAASAGAAQPEGERPPQTPEEELEAARKRQQGNLGRIAKLEIPMSAEPAFRFEA
ncbi:MAG: hypothetical protein IT158_02005 [Bryobacterales bacterium]|nr:hypothetical protein [Bryobacterales bacterium]